MVPICPKFGSLWLEILSLFNRKIRYLSSVCFEIQSIVENKTGSNKKRIWFERDKYKGIRRSKKTQKGFSNPLLRISISKIMWMNNIWLYFGSDLAAWPSGKAGDCKSFIPSSNLGVAWPKKYLGFLIVRDEGRQEMSIWSEARGRGIGQLIRLMTWRMQVRILSPPYHTSDRYPGSESWSPVF